MVYSDNYIKEKLAKELGTDIVQVEDISDTCGMKFNVLVVSKKFSGQTLLQRHRLVNTILEEEMKTIHALSQKTYTPDQWEKLQGNI